MNSVNTQEKLPRTKVVILLGIGIIIMLLLLNYDRCQYNKKLALEDYKKLYLASQDTITHWKNKYKHSVARTSVIQSSSTKNFIKANIKDAEVEALREVVIEYRDKLDEYGSVTDAEIETIIENRNKTKIVKADTVYRDNVVFIYPTYRDSVINKWITYRATMDKDTATFSLKVNNEFSAVVGKHKGKPFVDVILKNPYSSVTRLRTFQIEAPKPKKWGIGLQVGMGVKPMDITGLKIPVNPYVGLGISYNIIRF